MEDRHSKSQELRDRTKQFALRCLALASSLPAMVSGRAIANQLVRCGTSVGANYRAACRARSRAEFVSKLGIVEEEADESAFWMEIVIESKLKSRSLIAPLHQEAEEIVKMVVASIRSARNARVSGTPQSAIRNPN